MTFTFQLKSDMCGQGTDAKTIYVQFSYAMHGEAYEKC